MSINKLYPAKSCLSKYKGNLIIKSVKVLNSHAMTERNSGAIDKDTDKLFLYMVTG